VLSDGPTVRFLLVHSEARKEVPPFYIMRDKVTNELFAEFDRRNPGAVREPQWRLGARAAKLGVQAGMAYPAFGASLDPSALSVGRLAYLAMLNPDREDATEYLPHLDDLGSGPKQKQLPVMRVWVEDAHRCARWLGGLLPSEKEWDVAAGRWEKDRGAGPFEAPWKPGEIAVNRREKGPLPVGTAVKDRSKFSGCRDMAGNGLEWTRSCIFNFEDPGELRETGEELRGRKNLKFRLRGRSYEAKAPLTFEFLVGMAEFQPYERFGDGWHPLHDIGFRVVVPVPTPPGAAAGP
jgi:formylglycine-generating enzyme required for sulfatase activity